jgi:hypothetical protein
MEKLIQNILKHLEKHTDVRVRYFKTMVNRIRAVVQF